MKSKDYGVRRAFRGHKVTLTILSMGKQETELEIMYGQEPELRLLSLALLPPTTARPLDTPFIRVYGSLLQSFFCAFLKIILL